MGEKLVVLDYGRERLYTEGREESQGANRGDHMRWLSTLTHPFLLPKHPILRTTMDLMHMIRHLITTRKRMSSVDLRPMARCYLAPVLALLDGMYSVVMPSELGLTSERLADTALLETFESAAVMKRSDHCI
jgi:hypothetical protein